MPTVPATRKTRATHQSLVDAARDSVRRHGVLLPEAVAETAGVSPATLYTYFGSKDALLAAAFDAALGEIGDELSRILNVEKLLEDGLESVTRRLVRTVVKHFTQDARVVRLAIARLPESPEVVEVYKKRGDEQLALIGRFVKLGIAAGKVRDGEVPALSRAVMVQLQGLQNPIVLHSGAGPVVDEICRVVHLLLAPAPVSDRSP
ncbi:MAG TPA: TetR/AcrR family transcriptional regulator [Acidimicrobiia bacterium]|nr:TetR/AcrR family transcriptional regulator [Acidimicrobiia bacterium]